MVTPLGHTCSNNQVYDACLFDMQVVLRDLAKVHSLYLDNKKWLDSKSWLERKDTKKITEMAPLWRELLRHAHSEFPEFWPKDRYLHIGEHAICG